MTVQFQRLEKCHGILTAVISNLSENEAHDALNQMVGTQCYTGIYTTRLQCSSDISEPKYMIVQYASGQYAYTRMHIRKYVYTVYARMPH